MAQTNMLKEIQTASLNGVKFAFLTLDENGGMDRVVHSFVNSNKVIVQDMGLKPTSIKMKILYTLGLTDGTSYVDKRNSIVNEIIKGGYQELMHPFYGSLKVSPQLYDIQNNQDNINVPELQVEFIVVSREKILPPNLIGDNAEAKARMENIRKALEPTLRERFINKYKSSKFKTTLDSLKGKINGFINGIEDALGTLDYVANEFNSISNSLKDFRNRIDAIIVSPIDFYNSITSTLGALKNVIENPLQAFNAYNELFNKNKNKIFNENKLVENGVNALENTSNVNTIALLEKKNNEIAINQLIEFSCFNLALESLLEYEFQNTLEVLKYREIVSTIFKEYLTYSTDTSKQDINFPFSDSLPRELLDIVNELSIFFNDYFDLLLLNTFNVTEINVNNMSLYSLCYALYGNLEFKDTLLNLNKDRIINPRLLNGNILILRTQI